MPEHARADAVAASNPAQPVALREIEAAHARIRDGITWTDCDHSKTLSRICGCAVWLKFENLQFTGAFKERGALNRLLLLDAAQRARGVVAMSAGNHAQGVAHHARQLGIPTTIVMPEGTPFVKIENTRRLGATVEVTGATLEEAAAAAHAIAESLGATFVHPYDDVAVIAGQGTIAVEMLSDVADLDVLVVPIGGGGLIAGMAAAAKALKPDIEVIGVQTAAFPAVHNRFHGADAPMTGDTIAEGIAVASPGRITAEIIAACVDDIMLVDEPSVERAISLLLEIEKTVAEGAGAAGLAAVLSQRARFAGRRVGLVLCGGNIDLRLLASVLTREMARAGRLSQLAIALKDRPGQLARVSQLIGEVGANIVEVSHQRTFSDLPAKGALLEVVIETRDRAHRAETVAHLRANGFQLSVHGGEADADAADAVGG
ncbi:MAG: threonine ammonia-lyase [Pseudomonadota bacterium]